MDAFILGLVLLSAVLHVCWNMLAKGSGDKLSFAWLTTVGGLAALAVPFALTRLTSPGRLDGEVLAWAGGSGLMQAVYVILLFAAYSRADMSVVYPISRGLAPLMLLPLAAGLAGDAVSAGQCLGGVVVLAGTVAVGVSGKNGSSSGFPQAITLTVVTALTTAGYSLADRMAMRLEPGPAAVEFLFLAYLVLCVLLTAYIVRARPGFAAIMSQWAQNRRDVILVSILTPLSYLCIVAAFAKGNAVLVTVWRNAGIPLGSLAAAVVLGERLSPGRIAGSLAVFAGLAMLAMA
jgi:drug/metabolite transporter (DMT)-like permease